MIDYGPYELMCKDGVPENAVTKTDNNGNLSVLYIPTEKGAIFHASEQPYVLGEGGRGSAKSTTLRWDAILRCLMIPGYRALLLRRTFPQLRGSHFAFIATEGKKLGLKKDFNNTKFFLEFDNGSMLQFGHCESDAAINDYLSQEWEWIGFDELTTFNLNQFFRIIQSSRVTVNKAAEGRIALVRAATNPIGEGASWVKRFFLDKSVTESEVPDYKPSEWFAIKMNVIDNPHMDAKTYKQKLAMLPNESLRRAYTDGEWLVEGQFFAEFRERTPPPDSEEWHVIQEMPKMPYNGVKIPIHQVPWVQVARFVDWGYSEIEPGYCGWVAMLPDGTAILFKEWVFTGHTPEKAAERIKFESKGMNIRMTLGDPMMWQERTGESIAETFARNGVSMIEANNDRENGWMRLHSWFATTYNDGTGARPRLQFLAPQEAGTGLGVPYAIRTIPSLQTDPKKPRDTVQATGIEDHCADGLRYWASNRPAPSHEPVKTLDWVHPQLRQSMAEALVGAALELGDESVYKGR